MFIHGRGGELEVYLHKFEYLREFSDFIFWSSDWMIGQLYQEAICSQSRIVHRD